MTKTVVGAGSEQEARRQASRAGPVHGRLLFAEVRAAGTVPRVHV